VELILPLSNTGRKYGYIMWAKSQEDSVRHLVGGDTVTLLLPGGIEKTQHVDWKHRRISLSYSLTRNLPVTITTIELKADAPGRVEVTFR